MMNELKNQSHEYTVCIFDSGFRAIVFYVAFVSLRFVAEKTAGGQQGLSHKRLYGHNRVVDAGALESARRA